MLKTFHRILPKISEKRERFNAVSVRSVRNYRPYCRGHKLCSVMRYSNYTEEGVESSSRQKRGMKVRGDGRGGLGFPVPTLQDSQSRITSFSNERGTGPTLEDRARAACQITITTSVTHNAPHPSFEPWGWKSWGNTPATLNDILLSPQTGAVLWQLPKHSTGRTKQNKVHCGYCNCGGKWTLILTPGPRCPTNCRIKEPGAQQGGFTGRPGSLGWCKLILYVNTHCILKTFINV